MKITRTIGLLLFLGMNAFCMGQNIYHPEINDLYDQQKKVFPFGVASGDPSPNGVVLWTKLWEQDAWEIEITWEIAQDSLFTIALQSGKANTGAKNAYTVKVLVDNLLPSNRYYYRFTYKGISSPTGLTYTAGNPKGRLKIAVVSCNNYMAGEFNAFGHLALRNDIQAVIHLGDNIYEEAIPYKADKKRTQRNIIRQHIPNHEISNLQDYRSRYAQYLLDEQLQACRAKFPFISIWDDHEFVNNINAQGKGKDWAQRLAIAKQAFFEWMPIIENKNQEIDRTINFGNFAQLWLLDGRIKGRSPQVLGINDPNIKDSTRTLLGEEQRNWLLSQMANSDAQWKIIGNPVLFSKIRNRSIYGKKPSAGMDFWEGYPIERETIFNAWKSQNINNIVVLTGDIHTAWAFDLSQNPLDKTQYSKKNKKGVIGMELVTPSVSSFNLDEVMPGFLVGWVERSFKKKKNNPHLKFVDLKNHGYMTVEMTEKELISEWVFMKKVRVKSLKTRKGKKIIFQAIPQ